MSSTAFTGTIPENYDHYMGPWIFEPYAADLAARIQPGSAHQVLEIACGTGRVTAHLRRRLASGAQLVATDLNADMIALARTQVTEPGIEWQTADAQVLPFADHRFDLVVFQFGLMFVPDKSKALAEVRRVLKPGGRLLLSTWGRLSDNPAFDMADKIVARHFPDEPPRFFQLPFSLYDEHVLAELLADAGFSQVNIELVKKDCTSSSAADTARGMLEGSPVYTAIMDRDPARLPLIKKELVAALAARYGHAPFVSPMQAWMVMAEK